MEAYITQQNPSATFALSFSFSKMLIEKIRVPSLEPDKIPVFKVTVKSDNKIKEYRIDLKNSLNDEMELPIFDVYTEFPIRTERIMSIDKSTDNYIKIDLEKGDWINIEYSNTGQVKRLK